EYQHSYVVVSDVIYSIIDPARNSSHRQTEYRYGGSLLAVEGKGWVTIGFWANPNPTLQIEPELNLKIRASQSKQQQLSFYD
ncbi:MAG: hypothetical protein WBB29_22250, partial [Geitlerinemataceae cyanobacterium]